MSIAERQFEELTADRILAALQEGRLPSLAELEQGLNDLITRSRKGLPLMRVRPQTKRGKWDVKSFNKTVKEIEFDIQILLDELVSMGARLLRRHNFQVATHQAQTRQLDALLGQLDDLLFTFANADDRFFGAFDNFTDLSKINLEGTTRNAVNLEENVVLLPAGVNSAKKLKMTHLQGRRNWGVKPFAGDGVRVLGNSPGSDAPFGNAFHDLINVWRQDVFTDTPGPVTIEFTIPVSAIETQSATITRVQLIPHNTQVMKARVLYSADGANWIALPNGGAVRLDRSGREHNLDFQGTRIRYLRFQITSETFDEQINDGRYRYSFGFQHIGLYTMGRVQDARLISSALQPENLTGKISKVSIFVKEDIPAQCDINYFIAPATAAGIRLADWRPISPIGRMRSGHPEQIVFSNDGQKKIAFRATAPVAHSTRKNHTYFVLDDNQTVSDDVIFGSAKLLRGRGAWIRNKQKSRVLRTINDAYIDFSSGNTQKIYAVVKEVASVSSKADPNDVSDPSVTWLEVDHDIDYDSSWMTVTPPDGVNVDSDQKPSYALYRVQRFRQKMTIEDESVTLTGFANQLLSQPNVLLRGTSAPVVTNLAGTVVYQENVDYVLSTDANGAAQIRRSAGTSTAIGDGDTVLVTYTLDPDITDLVDNVYRNAVILKKDLQVADDERFEVTYRFVPTGDNAIVKSTVRVTERYGQETGRIYEEGPDYSIDVEGGTITRIPQGAIQGAGVDSDSQVAAYVDFKYEETPSGLETFSTWAFVEGPQPVQFEFNSLNLDLDEGEKIEVISGPDQQDLTRETSSPELSRGWHQFIVQSKNPDSFTDAAIRKISTLKDTDNNAVFVGGGRYFSRLNAFRTPMRQVTLDYLRTGVLPSNHDVFAVDSDGKIVVTFEPGQTDDLFLYGIRLDPTTGELSTGTFAEEYELEYRFELTNAVNYQYLVFKAELSRNSQAENGLTPKLHEYHVRIA